jgi:hypothetical protein
LQTDLFNSALAPAALQSLELHHDEIVELVSRLLWQVVHDAEASPSKESSNEQDQP